MLRSTSASTWQALSESCNHLRTACVYERSPGKVQVNWSECVSNKPRRQSLVCSMSQMVGANLVFGTLTMFATETMGVMMLLKAAALNTR